MRPRCVGLIPARAGSKGVPGKNRLLVPGQIAEARKVDLLEDVAVSSDEFHSEWLDNPLNLLCRPAELARDEVPMRPVVRHACRELWPGPNAPDGLILLLPTYPRRTSRHIERIYWEWARHPEQPLVGLVPALSAPELLFRSEAGRMVPVVENAVTHSGRRQERPPAYEVSLFACVVPLQGPHDFRRTPEPYGPNMLLRALEYQRAMVLDREDVLDVDTERDLQEAIGQ